MSAVNLDLQKLVPRCVIPSLSAKKPDAAIREIVNHMSDLPEVLDADRLADEVIARERSDSTAIGLGIAIPHARTDAVSETVLAFGRSEKGISFKARDKKPVHLVLLMGIPPTEMDNYIVRLATLSRMLKREEIRVRFMQATSEEDIKALFREYFADRNGIAVPATTS